MPEPVEYEVRVLGRIDPAASDAFGDFAIQVEPAKTVLSGAFDQATLLDLLERARSLGLEVVDVRRAGLDS